MRKLTGCLAKNTFTPVRLFAAPDLQPAILKSGCWAEDARLGTSRPTGKHGLRVLHYELESALVDSGNRQAPPGSLNFYFTKLARLGGYLASTSDPPSGNEVVWRGLSRLTDIRLGTEIAATLRCG